MKVVITMAGQGVRFKEKGYTVEKYEIPFHGKTLFEWSIVSLVNFRKSEFIFVARDTPRVRDFIKEKCRQYGIKRVRVKILDSSTRGQAETAMLAGEFFDEDDSVIIFNIDTHVSPEQLKPRSIRGNGWIPVFSAPGDRWSFVETVGDGMVLRTTEKVRISNKCCIGLYYFDSFRKFEKLVRARAVSSSEGEWYIAPLYNDFIEDGNKVYVDVIPSECVVVLGTPEDIAEAERRLSEHGSVG